MREVWFHLNARNTERETWIFARSHGMTTLTFDRRQGRASTSASVAQPGLNYRMDEIRAAIGLVQLDKLPEGNSKRGILTNRYRYNLEGSPVSIPFEDQKTKHKICLPYPASSASTKYKQKKNNRKFKTKIESKPAFIIHLFGTFQTYQGQFSPNDAPVTAMKFCLRQLTLPLFPTMTEDEVDQVCSALLRGAEMIDEKRILELIGRKSELFRSDINSLSNELEKKVENASFLVIGGGGSIGQAVTKEIFKKKSKKHFML